MKHIFTFLVLFLFSFQIQAQWNLIYSDSTFYEIYDLYFFNKDTGLICGFDENGHGFVQKTTNGGNTWNNIPTWPFPAGFFSITFVNDTLGFMAGQDGGVYKSIDSGNTWNWLISVNPNQDIDQIYFITDSIALTRHIGGTIWKSTDQANNWLQVASTTFGNGLGLQGKNNPIEFINDSVGYTAYGGIYKTVDQGDTWNRLNADTTHFYRGIFAVNNQKIIAVGNCGSILTTTNGGNSWTHDSITNQDLRDLYFINNNIGFCIGGGFDYWTDTTGIVLTTLDGGLSWTTSKISDVRLNSIQIIDSVGYIVGNKGRIFKNSNVLTTSVNQLPTSDYEFFISPNPSSKFIEFGIKNLNTNVKFDIKVIDMLGQIVFEKSETYENYISVREINSGTYLLLANCKFGSFAKKIIIKK